MTKADLTLVYESADNKKFKVPAYPNINTECHGIAYWTAKRPVTLVGAVALLRWQAKLMLGGWDSGELQTTLILLQEKAILLSSSTPTGEKSAEVEKLLEREHHHDKNCNYKGAGIWNCGTVDQS